LSFARVNEGSAEICRNEQREKHLLIFPLPEEDDSGHKHDRR